ncbi:DUF3310 domain-containing protein [Puerhibacterium puerhi]|uniref:DUF3310 domain-containing protein n=1 Tax=Puerhibacterium puerhi TaxID=2692623 RepID=UPI0019154759|nr:DUF3310 domain-containing protein [Puerhibacterium puerhi]
MTHEFEPGDLAVVTGDAAHWDHQFPSGTVVEVVAPESGSFLVTTHSDVREWTSTMDGAPVCRSVHATDLKPLPEGCDAKPGDTCCITDGRICAKKFTTNDLTVDHTDIGKLTISNPVKAENDAVDHPAHYSTGMPDGVEVIDVIRAQGWLKDYALGNVVKYVLRAQYKGNALEDLKKAHKYLGWAIEEIEKEDA